MTIYATATKKLAGHPKAQATVVFAADGSILLVSYTTKVAEISPDGWLHINGLYSMTTRKHIGLFMREYVNSYYHVARYLFENRLKMNVHTGEIVEI